MSKFSNTDSKIRPNKFLNIKFKKYIYIISKWPGLSRRWLFLRWAAWRAPTQVGSYRIQWDQKSQQPFLSCSRGKRRKWLRRTSAGEEVGVEMGGGNGSSVYGGHRVRSLSFSTSLSISKRLLIVDKEMVKWASSDEAVFSKGPVSSKTSWRRKKSARFKVRF